MKTRRIFSVVFTTVLILGIMCAAQADPFLQKCAVPAPGAPHGQARGASQPECSLEITCTDKPVLLGNQGVCFRATCPGIWGLMHSRVDQSSFRRRFFTYRHFAYKGHWELKDQGVIEAGSSPVRELFLVLPDDLIEFKLSDADCYAKVEIKKLGYIKTGCLKELQEWLAYNSYLENAGPHDKNRGADQGASSCRLPSPMPQDGICGTALNGLLSWGRTIGLPFCGR